MRKLTKSARKHANALALAVSTGVATVSQNVLAAVDLTEVETSLTAAQTSGESVGTLVIGVVAGLVVVGIIIGMVKKL